MKSFIRKTRIVFGTLFLCFSLSYLFSIEAHAWEAHLNEENDVEIYTVDRARTHDVWYYTEGVTITRCQYNPTTKAVHDSGEFFPCQLENPVEILENNVYRNVFTVSMEDILNSAASTDQEWADEIQKAIDGEGPAVYIKLDCIMYIVNDDTGEYFGPYVNAPGVYGGDGERRSGISPNGDEIGDFPWTNREGVYTHYNHYLLIGEGEEDEPIVLPDELVTNDYTMDHYGGIDQNQPAFAMSNSSDIFDLSQGIPSSEYIKNDFLADSWYGKTDVYARTYGQHYYFLMTYIYNIDYGGYQWIDINLNGQQDAGELVWIPNIVVYSTQRELDIGTAYVAFQYLSNTSVYDFTNADIGNGAYEGDHVFYDDIEEIPMECIASADYKNIADRSALVTADPDWIADTDKHVKMAKRRDINYPNIRELGTFLPSQLPNLEAEANTDIQRIRSQISANTKTRNDKLVIDGITFMRNDWVTGCDFFDQEPSTYSQCTSSSAWRLDYCLQNGTRPLHETDPRDVIKNVSVQIPATVDNGYYMTNIKVYYQRLIIYDRRNQPFEAD